MRQTEKKTVLKYFDFVRLAEVWANNSEVIVRCCDIGNGGKRLEKTVRWTVEHGEWATRDLCFTTLCLFVADTINRQLSQSVVFMYFALAESMGSANYLCEFSGHHQCSRRHFVNIGLRFPKSTNWQNISSSEIGCLRTSVGP